MRHEPCGDAWNFAARRGQRMHSPPLWLPALPALRKNPLPRLPVQTARAILSCYSPISIRRALPQSPRCATAGTRAPETEQRDLMAQIIDVIIPADMKPTVRDAMQYVFNRSGYSLCGPDQGHINILFTRPLPTA